MGFGVGLASELGMPDVEGRRSAAWELYCLGLFDRVKAWPHASVSIVLVQFIFNVIVWIRTILEKARDSHFCSPPHTHMLRFNKRRARGQVVLEVRGQVQVHDTGRLPLRPCYHSHSAHSLGAKGRADHPQANAMQQNAARLHPLTGPCAAL